MKIGASFGRPGEFEFGGGLARPDHRQASRAHHQGRQGERGEPFRPGQAEKGGAGGEAKRQEGGVNAEHESALAARRGGADPEFAEHEDDGQRQPEGEPNHHPQPVVAGEREAGQRGDGERDGAAEQVSHAEAPGQRGRERRADQRGEAGHGDLRAIVVGGESSGLKPQRQQRNHQGQADADDGNAGDGGGERFFRLGVEGGHACLMPVGGAGRYSKSRRHTPLTWW